MHLRRAATIVVLAGLSAGLAACEGVARPIASGSVADGCTVCHLTATAGGAHDAHVLALSGEDACTECHPGPAGRSPEHLDGGVDVVFGALATQEGALASSFDPGERSCATVYCHGAFEGGNAGNAPGWGSGTGGAACGTCHGTPGATGAHAAHVQVLGEDLACTECHPDPLGGSAVHVDGQVDVALGTLATRGGALASRYDPGARSCATVYCHGAFEGGNAANAPAWGSGPGGAACGSCHETPAATGAHAAHVQPLGELACTACHPDPLGGSAVHADGRVDVAFGAVATRDGALASRYDAGAQSCATVYCHGAFEGGNAANAPAWGTGGAACGSCHGTPSATGAHAAHVAALGELACTECHPDPRGGSAVHADGRVDVAFGALATRDGALAPRYDPVARSCATVYCHGAFEGGSAANTPAWGAGPDGAACGSCHGTSPTTGAHAAHVQPPGALACTECHPHADGASAVHADGRVDVAFGALATRGGTLAADYDAGSRSCATVYCHGAFEGGTAANAPEWASGQGGAACGTCHPLPPAATHVGVAPDPAGCVRCHASTVDAGGALVAGGTHANGSTEGRHDASWLLASSPGFHGGAAQQGLSACQGCHGERLEGGSGVACADCHGSGGVLSCASCHDPVVAGANAARSAHFRGADPSGDCRACHDTFPDEGGHYRLPAPGGSFPDGSCVACHTGAGETLSGRTPPKLEGWTNVASGDFHGARAGAGSGGTLKPPYVRGQGPLPCGDCHGEHSGANAFLFRDAVNGTPIPAGAIDRAGVGGEALCNACHAGNRHASCAACHVGDPEPPGSPCFWCHGHEGIVRWTTPYTDCDQCHEIFRPPTEYVPPSLTQPAVTALTASTATIQWSTNELATSYVEYGIGAPRQSAGNFDIVLEHVVTLTGLTPATEYVWRVRTTDQFRNVAWSALRSFTTPAAAPPP
jgi:predicted CxxxxCH...CXXCH cytochrome family protein